MDYAEALLGVMLVLRVFVHTGAFGCADEGR